MWGHNSGADTWLFRVGNYCLRVGDALSQLVNVTLFLSSDANESVSARAYRQRSAAFWGTMRISLDTVFLPFEKEHCKKAHTKELLRARKLIQGVL